jgi:hypothetical protein
MGAKQAHEPASTPRVPPVVEATSYGALFGVAGAVAAAVLAWLVIRVGRRRSG